MGRGKRLATKLKREILDTVPVAIALKEAERKIEQRKPLKQSLEEHLGKFIDRIDADTVLKLAGWLTLSYFIKGVLERDQEVQALIAKSKAMHSSSLPGAVFAGVEPFETADSIASWLESWLLGHPLNMTAEQAKAISEGVKHQDLEQWALALGIAALIITFGPDMIKAFGSVGKLALGLLA